MKLIIYVISCVLQQLAGIYGDDQFNNKKYVKAGQLYFETYRSFDEISLKFLNAQIAGDQDARDGLEG